MQCDVIWCALQWSRCVFEVILWQCGDPKNYSVLQSTTVYYTVLLQYYSVLQSTTPVLLCTTQYYNVLLQYYSVLQSTTPVLLCTTKYYSVLHSLLQYYPVLQSTTLVLLCTAKYYSSTLYCKVLFQYYSVLHSTTTYYSSTTLYWSTTPVLLCTTKQHSWLILDTYEPLFTWLMSVAYETSFIMRGATGVILQLHQILHLPRKMTVMIDPRHICNVIYNKRSNRSHNPTSPNTAPATQNDSHDWSASHMKRHLQCAEQQTHTATSPNTAPAMQNESLHWAASHIKRHLQCAEKQTHTATSPNTAPAMQNESLDWAASHMKRHLQCAEQAKSPSNLTKCCACHEICKFKISAETPWIASANRKTIRGHSDDKSSSRTCRLGDLPRPTLETHLVWKNTTFRVPAIYQNFTKCCACHEK